MMNWEGDGTQPEKVGVKEFGKSLAWFLVAYVTLVATSVLLNP